MYLDLPGDSYFSEAGRLQTRPHPCCRNFPIALGFTEHSDVDGEEKESNEEAYDSCIRNVSGRQPGVRTRHRRRQGKTVASQNAYSHRERHLGQKGHQDEHDPQGRQDGQESLAYGFSHAYARAGEVS
jgi:hypothetical protein